MADLHPLDTDPFGVANADLHAALAHLEDAASTEPEGIQSGVTLIREAVGILDLAIRLDASMTQLWHALEHRDLLSKP